MNLYKNTEFKLVSINDKNKNIPSSWNVDKIGKLFTLVGGGTPSTTDSSYWNGTIPWVGPKEMSECENSYISKGGRFLSKKGAESLGNKKVLKNGVVISTRAPVGYIKIADNDLYTNQGCHSVQPNENILTEYIYFWFILNNSVLERNSSGTTFKELSATSFKNIDFIYPPKIEQEKIVILLKKQESILNKYNDLNSKTINTINYYLKYFLFFRILVFPLLFLSFYSNSSA
jgi:type I restriction enzyme, S subunit